MSEKTLKELITEMDRIEAEANDFDFEKSVDDTFATGAVADTLGFSPRGELIKAFYRAIKAIMPDASDQEIKARAEAATKAAEQWDK